MTSHCSRGAFCGCEGLGVDGYIWCVIQADLNERQGQPEARHVKPGEHDWETLRRLFGWASVDLVEKTSKGAYLEVFTKEKLSVKAGPEFGDHEGHILLVKKALHGLRTPGVRWHGRLTNCLRGMGFFPCKAEPDTWMQEKTNHWEYIGTYADDLAITSKDPQTLGDRLVKDHKFKFKGTGPISYHLGCDFMHDEDKKLLCIQLKKYIEWMVETYVRWLGRNRRNYTLRHSRKGDQHLRPA